MPAALIERLGTEDAQQFTQLRMAAIHDIQARMPKDASYVPVPAYYYSESSDKEDAMRRDFSAAEKLGLQVAWIDQTGCVHQVSPICTHMGGVVHWNEAAQTWDCPVHGGRFSPNGERLYGPPSENLGDRES